MKIQPTESLWELMDLKFKFCKFDLWKARFAKCFQVFLSVARRKNLCPGIKKACETRVPAVPASRAAFLQAHLALCGPKAS